MDVDAQDGSVEAGTGNGNGGFIESQDVRDLEQQLAAAVTAGKEAEALACLATLDTLFTEDGRWLGPQELARQLSVTTLVLCLDTAINSEDVVEAAARLLNKALHQQTPEALFSSLNTLVLQGLQHDYVSVRALTTEHLLRVARLDISALAKAFVPGGLLLTTAMCCLADDDSEVVGHVKALALLMADNDGLRQTLLAPECMLPLKSQCARSSTTRMRLQELIVKIACISGPALKDVTSHHLLADLVTAMTSDDVLVQLNALELIGLLAAVQHGTEFLVQSGLLHTALRGLRTEIPMASLVQPSLYSLLSQCAKNLALDFHALNTEVGFLDALLQHMQSQDPILRNAAVSAAAAIGHTKSGLALFMASEHNQGVIKALGAFAMARGNPELQAVGLHAVATVIDENLQAEDGNVRQTAFELAGGQKLASHATVVVKNPFEDLRTAAYHFLQSLASHRWGSLMLAGQAGFVEYLVNRNTEQAAAMKKWKFAVVEAIVRHKDLGLPGPQWLSLLAYCRDGVFFQGSDVAVAVDTEAM
eukprot:m.87950 g.87950  ORF g.87950 m.87950 type:complete len:534 (-) comp15153_c0_seq1:192-1793(-)